MSRLRDAVEQAALARATMDPDEWDIAGDMYEEGGNIDLAARGHAIAKAYRSVLQGPMQRFRGKELRIALKIELRKVRDEILSRPWIPILKAAFERAQKTQVVVTGPGPRSIALAKTIVSTFMEPTDIGFRRDAQAFLRMHWRTFAQGEWGSPYLLYIEKVDCFEFGKRSPSRPDPNAMPMDPWWQFSPRA